MYSNTFVSEIKETFTSTHKYLMNTLLSMLALPNLVETILPCLTGWPTLVFVAIANLFSAEQVSTWHFNLFLQVNFMQMKIS